MLQYMKPWTAYSVGIHENKALLDSMMETSHPGVKPTDGIYIGCRKTLTSRWYGKQPEMLHAKWKETATLWNTKAPPPEVQQK